MSRWSRRLCAAAAATVLAAAAAAPVSAAPKPPPRGFFGLALQPSLTATDFKRMQGVVETLRIPVYWFQCEPRPGEYDFSALDAQIAAAADHGLRVQPFVYGTPSWLASDPARPPLGSRAVAAWGKFLRVLVGRYGSGGEFWRGRAHQEPIKLWQVWNEPNFVVFWQPRPSPAGYARLLHASARAIRGADPRARIVLAGVAPVNAGMKTWVFLRRLFRRPSVRHDFDYVALHPYSTNVFELEYQVRRVRHVMAMAGVGRLPLLVTEVGVASWGDYPSAFVEGSDGQAHFLEAAFQRLLEMRRRWRLAGIDWYTWRDQRQVDLTCSFCQGAGLVGLDGKPKPAWWAYRRAVREAYVR